MENNKSTEEKTTKEIVNENNILEHLYNKYGDFWVEQYIGDFNDNSDWSKWHLYSEKKDYTNKKLLRSIFTEELVLDIEDKNYEDIKQLMLKFNLHFKIFESGGRGMHIQLFFSELKNYDASILPYIKKCLIDTLSFSRGDLAKSGNKTLIGLEFHQHRKGGVKKLIYATEETFYSDNKLPQGIIDYIKTLPEKYEGALLQGEIKPQIIFKDTKPCRAISDLIKSGSVKGDRNKYANFIVQQLRDYCGYNIAKCLETIIEYNSHCSEQKTQVVIKRDLEEQYKRKYNINCSTLKKCGLCLWKHQETCSKYLAFNGTENKNGIAVNFDENIEQLSDKEVLDIYLQEEYSKGGDRCKASEILVKWIKKNNYLYTLKNDTQTETWIYNDGIYVPHGKSSIKEKLRNLLNKFYNNNICYRVISKIEADTFIDEKVFFSKENIYEMPVQNGILNIITKEITDFTPNKIFFGKIPIVFDKTKECPNINKFLSEVLKNKEDIPLIYELIGYCLLKDYRIEKAFMFIGGGRNGKSKTLELIKLFLGPENCVNIPVQEFEKDNFAVSQLHGKLANISGDLSPEALQNTGNFKLLTGGDIISANRKFLSRLTFANYSKQIFSANQLPRTYDLTPAFFNRWILLEFPYTFLSQKEIDKLDDNEKNNVKLADKQILQTILNVDELSGLLNASLLGLIRLLNQRDFSYSKSVADVKNMWIRKSDSFMSFCQDCIEEKYGEVIIKGKLRERYHKYCTNYKLKSEGDKVIKETLTREFGAIENYTFDCDEHGNSKREHVWENITFKDTINNKQDMGHKQNVL